VGEGSFLARKAEKKLKIWSYSQSHRIDGKGPLVDKANGYFEACEVHGLSPDTVRSYAFTLMAFFKWFKGDLEIFKKFNQKRLQDWMFELKKQECKARSINQMLVCVRGFYRFCFGVAVPHAPGVLYPKGYYKAMTRHPFTNRYRPGKSLLELKVKVEKRVVDPLKPKEVDTFLSDLKRYRDLAVVLTMLLCGLRSQEVISILLEDVNFHQSSLLVRGKGKRERVVPLPFQLMQVFEKYLEFERPKDHSQHFFVSLQGKNYGNKLNRNTFRAFFWYHRKKLGLPKARPHQFRHAFASDLARVGVPLTTIQRLLGHADPKTSLIYIELFLEDIRLEYERAMKRIAERYAAISSQKIT
jgi:site-specific recombinase XerD